MTDALAIPDFLRRERGDEPRPVRTRSAKKRRKTKVKLPKSWQGAKTAFVAAYPPVFPAHFPVGHRLVHYIEGRKDVRVREVVPTATCRAATTKLSKREFQQSLRSQT
jgi:hypothetical protein